MASRNDSLNAKKFLGICLWTSHAIKIDSYAFQNNLPSGRHSIPTQLGAKMLYIFFLTLSINSSLSHISQPSTYFTPSVRKTHCPLHYLLALSPLVDAAIKHEEWCVAVTLLQYHSDPAPSHSTLLKTSATHPQEASSRSAVDLFPIHFTRIFQGSRQTDRSFYILFQTENPKV